MQYEKPELETQRAEVLKLQGEQNVQLRDLEDSMLNTINDCQGSILEDDKVVTGMEALMKEGLARVTSIKIKNLGEERVNGREGDWEGLKSGLGVGTAPSCTKKHQDR